MPAQHKQVQIETRMNLLVELFCYLTNWHAAQKAGRIGESAWAYFVPGLKYSSVSRSAMPSAPRSVFAAMAGNAI